MDKSVIYGLLHKMNGAETTYIQQLTQPDIPLQSREHYTDLSVLLFILFHSVMQTTFYAVDDLLGVQFIQQL